MGSHRVGHDWSDLAGAAAFSPKFSLNIWKFLVHILLKPHLENFEHYFASMWDECNCVIVWTFFGIAFLWDWNENWASSASWWWTGKPGVLQFMGSKWVVHDWATELNWFSPRARHPGVKWALGNITMNKASGSDRIPAKLFKILKDEAVKVLHSICQQIWKTQQWHRTGQGQFSFQSQNTEMPKNVQATIQLCLFHMLAR